ncbi:hypothetical protein [Acinetobacter guillouiae]|uniref:Uncharacterized protein n=1 Tax=Acinetobacter guillouiae NIPH 991 TaxID=1217656 RepID=N8YBR6_ACIGI|nr:hypothetical protein [Acinetobacter guillouiae]ENV18774.1 hypothetical protein F964_00574 [Acinetobacter guillouiae NIPH 991]
MFYKVINQVALDTYNKLESDRLELRENAQLFADEYEADPVILQDSDSIWFCGIKFQDNSKVNREIWTKPERQYGHSRIRTKPLKKSLQSEFDAEKSKWDELYSQYFSQVKRVDKNSFYSTLGLDGSSFFFSSFKCFEYQGAFYIEISIDLKVGVEILGSEYVEAERAKNALKYKEPQQ